MDTPFVRGCALLLGTAYVTSVCGPLLQALYGVTLVALLAALALLGLEQLGSRRRARERARRAPKLSVWMPRYAGV